MRGRIDLLVKIKRFVKKNYIKSKPVTGNEKGSFQDSAQLKKIFEKISKLRMEQGKLETMVSDLENKSESIDMSTQMMMNSFYKKFSFR